MQIIIKLLAAGTQMTLTVQETDTVTKLKELIKTKIGMEPKQQSLIFAGNVLEDKMTLGDCNVTAESTLMLAKMETDPLDAPEAEIQVVFLLGKGSITRKIRRDTLVSDVKKTTAELLGVAGTEFNLIYKGSVLKDNDTLAKCEIKDSDVLLLTMIFRGGDAI